MAIINGILVPKARNSAGNITFRTVRGVTIFSEKIVKNDSNTPLQQEQRVKFGEVQKKCGSTIAALARATQRGVKTKSAYSRLMKALYVGIQNSNIPARFNNRQIFGDGGWYGEAWLNGAAMPCCVDGDLSPIAVSVRSFKAAEGNNAYTVFDFVLPQAPKEFDPVEGFVSPVRFGRLNFNSSGILNYQSVSVENQTVADDPTDFWAENYSPAGDSLVCGMDGEFFRLQVCVFLGEFTSEQSLAAVASPLMFASYRGLPMLNIGSTRLSMPWVL